ncbi:4-phosphoerythronate dehydrogenase [Legionella maioricensis]|uniref:4-phosphoerythronate dehydrogenase n=1 Tax=Legionella maioricensis TaxID=2896528 RepID=A0A9X2D513_9GAMM|nr:4-phosphoerythronate dehydrogenase [Legionella maioricensis]MCL9685617.1 4-phosphoerythronate dehydrogenase [Legionella maioricensis]MCL9689026.1 4-phosphoerythronate dehydrogenase [Legionella maioricensis]
MRILADASLPGLESAFPKPFILSRYSNTDELFSLLEEQDILLCRATLKVNSDLLKKHQLQYVATASSGTDHLDHYFLKSQKIQIVDAKGSNASSVADYVVACLAYLEQKNLIGGKRAGIIGLGEAGNKVYSRLKAADFQIMNYDPPKAMQEKQFESCALEHLYEADLLCIHAELHANPPYPSANLIDDAFLARLKSDCVIINAARGGIVNEKALLNTRHSLIYCTDVYLDEPAINKQIIDRATLCTPHIAGHSIEAKWTAVAMISEKLHRLLELPVPEFALAAPPKKLHLSNDISWQERVLSIYNPAEETLQLKSALDKKSTFLSLRKNHQKRHDFSLYSDLISDQQTRSLLGMS